MDERPYLTVAEVAAELGISRNGVYKLIQRGRLPAIRRSERSLRVARWTLDAYRRRLAGEGPDLRRPAARVRPSAMTPLEVSFDPAADIVWLRVPGYDPATVVGEPAGHALRERDPETGELVGVELWQASRTLPPELLDLLRCGATRRVQ